MIKSQGEKLLYEARDAILTASVERQSHESTKGKKLTEFAMAIGNVIEMTTK